MEIFKYSPNWTRIEKRRRLVVPGANLSSEKTVFNDLEFKLNNYIKQKKKPIEICSVCKKEKHLPSSCPERRIKPVKTEKKIIQYKSDFNLSPTTVKLMNVPNGTTQQNIRERLNQCKVEYDMVVMVHDKINREIFTGIVYIELPTLEYAQKCIAAFNNYRMDIQIVSAEIVQERRRFRE
ncbi:hypothetical protein NEOKW01_0496 [Nematocida sp. AWRm80]|nr:hypothetical protein NEOKW01_0496 [Nematocida sp. AWRm80]